MLWTTLVGEVLKEIDEPKREPQEPDETFEVNGCDLKHAIDLTMQYQNDANNTDHFITGVGMELALKLIGLWPDEED